MSKTTVLGALGALFLIAFGASSAQAQATRTWISGVGDDVNPCSRTAPCKTFPGAISKTAAGGEIDTLDPGGFGAVTVTKSITLASEGTGEGGILVAGTNGITINAGVNDVVIIRGLQLDGGPIGSNSLNGVRIIQAGTVEIQNSTFRNFTGGSPNGYAVQFQPSAAQSNGAPAQLFISDSTFTTNGQIGGSTGGGILVQPSGSASAVVTLNNVNLVNNVLGYRADASLTTGTISTSIANSTIAGNLFAGVSAFTVGAPSGTSASTIDLMRTTVSNNGGAGLNANGTKALIRLSDVSLTGNKTGVVVANSGVVATAVTNLNFDNTNAGSAPTSAPAN